MAIEGFETPESDEAAERERWTDKLPTEPGWYWWRPTGVQKGAMICKLEEDGLRAVGIVRSLDFDGGQWAGPLEAPK